MSGHQPQVKVCFHCDKDSPTSNDFCGSCGSPLTLDSYIASRVKAQLATDLKHRDVLEAESSIKVFTKAWGWMRLIGGIAVTLLLVSGGALAWKASGFWENVQKANDSVSEKAKTTAADISQTAAKSKQDLSSALSQAKGEIASTSSEAIKQSESMRYASVQAKNEISNETKTFRTDLQSSRQRLDAANKMQPELENLRQQLDAANKSIGEQQKVLSS